MGYESLLYVVEKSSKKYLIGETINNKEMHYASLIASFDLSKCYLVSDKMRKYPETDSYIYADDGNTKIIEDRYGEPLKEIPLANAIEIIYNAEIVEEYRRYAPCLALLESLQKHKKKWDEIVVLHYGY